MPGGTYRLYGLSVASPVTLPCPRSRRGADVTLVPRRALPRGPAAAARDWFAHRRLRDGSLLLRWRGLADVLVGPDGRDIAWSGLAGGTSEAFTGYLLSQVLSFSLLARGVEPLHASAVAVDGRVIAFLGDCGLGKSSLTAAFLRAGYHFVTDDLLVLREGKASYEVEPGMPRIKLFPAMARRLLGVRAGPAMSPGSAKLVLPVSPAMTVHERLPLHTLYVLSRGRAVRLGLLAPSAVLLEIVSGAFNTVRMDRARLVRQFAFARRLAGTARVRRLSYPRRLSCLERVRDAILNDLA